MLSSTRGSYALQWIFITVLALGGGEALSASEDCAVTEAHAKLGNLHRRRTWVSEGTAAASDHAKTYCVLAGYNAKVGRCGDVKLGPLPEAQYTPEEGWLKFIETACPLEVLPRELLQEDSVWTYLTGLCAGPLDQHPTAQPILNEDLKRITGKNSLPRACGLLALIPSLRKEKPQPASSSPAVTTSTPKTAPPPQAAARGNASR